MNHNCQTILVAPYLTPVNFSLLASQSQEREIERQQRGFPVEQRKTSMDIMALASEVGESPASVFREALGLSRSHVSTLLRHLVAVGIMELRVTRGRPHYNLYKMKASA